MSQFDCLTFVMLLIRVAEGLGPGGWGLGGVWLVLSEAWRLSGLYFYMYSSMSFFGIGAMRDLLLDFSHQGPRLLRRCRLSGLRTSSRKRWAAAPPLLSAPHCQTHPACARLRCRPPSRRHRQRAWRSPSHPLCARRRRRRPCSPYAQLVTRNRDAAPPGTSLGRKLSHTVACTMRARPATSTLCCRRSSSWSLSDGRSTPLSTLARLSMGQPRRACRCSSPSSSRACSSRAATPPRPPTSPPRSVGPAPSHSGSTTCRSCAESSSPLSASTASTSRPSCSKARSPRRCAVSPAATARRATRPSVMSRSTSGRARRSRRPSASLQSGRCSTTTGATSARQRCPPSKGCASRGCPPSSCSS